MTTVIMAMTMSVCVFIFYSEGPFECPLDSEKFQKQEVMNNHLKIFLRATWNATMHVHVYVHVYTGAE